MPIHQDEFQTFMRELVTEAEGSPDGLSGIDLLAEMCGRLREFLDEHEATDYEFRVLVVLFLNPFLWATDLPYRAKEEIRRKCADALGIDILRTH